jgi:hypothetical protein
MVRYTFLDILEGQSTQCSTDEEGAKEKLYSYVQAVNVKDAKGLQTALVEDA